MNKKSLFFITQKENSRINSPEVELALCDQRVDQTVHDWHQNEDQDGVDSLVGMRASRSFVHMSNMKLQEESYLHLFRLHNEKSLTEDKQTGSGLGKGLF